MNIKKYGARSLVVVGLLLSASWEASASENGTSFYLLGSKGPMAAVLPMPGLYLQNDLYYYTAKAGASQSLPRGGNVVVDLDAKALLNLPTLIWSTPYTLLGGRVALGLTLPFGRESTSANLAVGPFSGRADSHITTLGDPIFMTTLGWSQGAYHWSVNGMLNVPAGHYRKDSMANIAFHRWGADLSLAGTWYDPSVGWDVSGVVGVTFNGKNPATDYRTGSELHLEAAVSRDIGSPATNAGVIGYYHQQISDDRGAGAVLGGFRGRTAALGLTASHAVKWGNKPVQARVKVLREFNTKNRVRGTAIYLTLSLPFLD